MNFFIGPVRDIAKVTDADTAAADFDIADRTLVVPNAVKPILVMVIAFIEFDIAVCELNIFYFFGCKTNLAAIHIDAAFSSDKLNSKAFLSPIALKCVITTVLDDYSIGIVKLDSAGGPFIAWGTNLTGPESSMPKAH